MGEEEKKEHEKGVGGSKYRENVEAIFSEEYREQPPAERAALDNITTTIFAGKIQRRRRPFPVLRGGGGEASVYKLEADRGARISNAETQKSTNDSKNTATLFRGKETEESWRWRTMPKKVKSVFTAIGCERLCQSNRAILELCAFTLSCVQLRVKLDT